MPPKLAEKGVYVDEEDLTDAPPEVLQFLLTLKDKKSNETGRQSRRRTEAGCRTQHEELGKLIRSLTETIQKSAGQDPSRSTDFAGALSSPTIISKIDAFIAAVNALNADLGTSLSVGQPRQEAGKNTRRPDDLRKPRAEGQAEDSESGETSTVIFGRDVVMVDMPAESAEQSGMPGRAVDLLPVEELGPMASSPKPSGSDSDTLEELVRFGSEHWPGKNLDCFRPGHLVTGDFLEELLRADLPAGYALQVPPNRVAEMGGQFAGICLFSNVTDTNQLLEDENNRDHFVIAIVNGQDKTFTSWGMCEAKTEKWTAAYGKGMGFDLAGIGHKLSDCTGNCSALRCVEAVRSYFNVDTTVRNELSLRLYFLKRLLEAWNRTTTQMDESQVPGKSVTAVAASSYFPSRDQPGQTVVTRLTATESLSDHQHNADRPNTARTPLPSTQAKQPSAGRRSSQDLNKEGEVMPTRKQVGAAGRTRKRSAMVPASTQSREKDDSSTESAEPPPKRKEKEGPSPEILAEELTGSDAVERIRQYVVAYKRDAPVLSEPWDEHADWVKQADRFLDLAEQWEKRSKFSSLVALILRTHMVERIYIEARREFKISEEADDPSLPTSFIDQISPRLRQGCSSSIGGFRTWLKGTKNLVKLSGYLPFIPLGIKSVAFRKYERLPNEAIQRLRNVLNNSSRAQRLAKIGRAFEDCILKRQAFVWEDFSCEDLSKLPDEPLLHLLTIRLDSVGKRCDLCDEETCELFTPDELACRQPMSPARDHDALERVSSPHHNNTTTEIWTFETSPPAPTALRTADYHPSAALLPPAHVPTPGPQFQLKSPGSVPDTAQSISFAMNGNIEGLKYLFTLGLANPNDTSCSRRFSLLRWALYGGHSGMHHYEAVKFLVDHGARVDDELCETVEYYKLSNKYSSADKQALRCLPRQDSNWFGKQKFPLIHMIIFRVSSKPLVQELVENPEAVHATDAQGRTALDWATIRAQLDDMQVLLAFKSNPNSMDVFGRTTVLHAVDSRDTGALRIILKAGGIAEPQIPDGLFRGNPLTSANLNGSPEMVRLLIEHGAKIDVANPEGLTALHSAAVSQNPECASRMLAHGADTEHMSSNRCTPLMTAIMHNSHAVLRLLLGNRAGCLNSSLLPVIDQYADFETRSILSSSQIFDNWCPFPAVPG